MSCQCIAIDYVRELRQVMSESCDRSCQLLRYVMPVWRKSFSPNSLPEQLFCKMFGALEKTPYLCNRN